MGRPNPLYFAEKLTRKLGGAKIYLKREDLNHTGAHKVNNTIGQGLLASRMGKKRVIAETGAGQHGVATATIAALMGMECEVFMGEEDIHRQSLNVFRMKLLGATVTPVTSGTATLKDAMNEAMRNWVTYVASTFYVIGTVAGPHPYPMMVRDFQSVIGKEVRKQHLKAEGRLPDILVAAVGGGSNALGLFYPFLNDTGGKAGRRGGRRLRHRLREARSPPLRRFRGGPPRQQDLPPPGPVRPDHPCPLHLRGTRLPRRRSRSTPGSRIRAGPSMSRLPMMRRSRRSPP